MLLQVQPGHTCMRVSLRTDLRNRERELVTVNAVMLETATVGLTRSHPSNF